MGSLKKNFAYQSMYQILLILLPLVTTPYIARALGKENSGIYSYCNTIATYFVVFGNLGIEQYGNRCIARVRKNYEDMSRVFSELVTYHLFTSFIAVFLYYVCAVFIVRTYKVIALIEGLYVISVLFDVNWFFFGIEKFKITVIRSACIKIVSAVLIFIFVKTKNDLPIYTLIMAGSTLVSQIVTWPFIKRYVSFRRIEIAKLKVHTVPLIFLFIAIISANLNRVIDKAMLGWFGFISDLGCYDYADRIIRIPLGVIAALGTVMLSKMSNLYADKKNQQQVHMILDISAYVILIFSIAFGFGLAAISPEFIEVYLGAEYKETATLIFLLAASVPLVGWNNFVRTQILIPTQKDSIYMRAVLTGAIINILVNIILIRTYSARGAAIATVLSYSVITLIQTKYAVSELKAKKIAKFIPIPISAGLFMYSTVRIVANVDVNQNIKIVVELLAGIVVYSSIILAYMGKKEPYMLNYIIGSKRKRT